MRLTRRYARGQCSVAEVGGVRVAELARRERRDDLADAVGNALLRLESELGADALEAHLVVARILAALHVDDLAHASSPADSRYIPRQPSGRQPAAGCSPSRDG